MRRSRTRWASACRCAHLAILVPLSFIVQMLPVSVNGFGVREQTFVLYLTRLGLPIESALALSFIGAVLIMLFSTTGSAAYLSRRHHRLAGAGRRLREGGLKPPPAFVTAPAIPRSRTAARCLLARSARARYFSYGGNRASRISWNCGR